MGVSKQNNWIFFILINKLSLRIKVLSISQYYTKSDLGHTLHVIHEEVTLSKIQGETTHSSVEGAPINLHMVFLKEIPLNRSENTYRYALSFDIYIYIYEIKPSLYGLINF